MKKLNKKGFTFVELLVVIVIIGILAAVIVPSVAGNIDKANKSAAEQDAVNSYKALLSELDLAKAELPENFVYITDKYIVLVKDGALSTSIEKNDITVEAAATEVDAKIGTIDTPADTIVAIKSATGISYLKAVAGTTDVTKIVWKTATLADGIFTVA